MCGKGFEVVTPEHWASLVKHIRVEDHYWEVDGGLLSNITYGSSPSVYVSILMMTPTKSPVVSQIPDSDDDPVADGDM